MTFRTAAFCCLLAFASLIANVADAANSMGIAFKYTTNTSLYGKRTGTLITGRCNRYASGFAYARSKGAEILAYLNPVERPDNYVCALDQKFYMGNYGSVPLWRYPSYGQRINFAGHHMTDMRPGSTWILKVVSQVEALMRENKVDGVFLDVVGARLWSSLSNWGKWPQWERDLWTDGNIDLVRRLDAKRRAIRPGFLIVNNNVWARGDSRGYAGERYVDGVSIEHPAHPAYAAWHVNYVGRSFGGLGHRRVLLIARNTTDAKAWAKVRGVTHVSDQPTSRYTYPTYPPVGFTALYDR